MDYKGLMLTISNTEYLGLVTFRVALLLLRVLRAPYFKEANITKFLERFKNFYIDYRIKEADRTKRLLYYYKIAISQFIKSIPKYDKRD
jgi:hypothetical protein